MRTKKTTKTPAKKATPKAFCFHNVTDEEAFPENEILLEVTLDGRPATKKTHQNIVFIKGYPRILPSSQYIKYEKSCKQTLEDAWINKGNDPMDFGIGIEARIWLDNWIVGDHTGYQQALGDILQKWGVIKDDSWIMWINNSDKHWLGGIDKDNPRVEITITRVRHPKENYRTDKENEETKKMDRKNAKTQNSTV